MKRRHFLGSLSALAGTRVLLTSGSAQAQATRAATTPTEPFTFAAVADPHCAEKPKDGITKLGGGVDKFLTCLKALSALPTGKRPDFVLLLGDVHPQALGPRMGDAQIPIHPVAGNHEGSKEKRKLLRKLFPQDFQLNGEPADYYSFVHKGVRFIATCDAGAGGDHVGHFSSEIIRPMGQCEWIERQLREQEQTKIFFGHIPPQRAGRDQNMYICRNDSRWLMDQFKATRPTAAFFGHLHRATEEYAIGDTRCFNCRSCCWNGDRSNLGALLVHVRDGVLKTEPVDTGSYT